jgi:hypothetical protein
MTIHIWRMRISRWIPKATSTHSEYVILMAFLLKQWLHERAQVSRFAYIACTAFSDLITVAELFRSLTLSDPLTHGRTTVDDVSARHSYLYL